MKKQKSSLPGKILYSLVFMVALPALLWWWATGADHAVPLPVIQSAGAGLGLATLGALLLLAGMLALWRYGGGLPMNAYPPPNYVRKSVYAWMPHPIYIGFSFLCWGVSAYTGSAAGFWLVSPVVALGCAALVLGYENPDLRLRFPNAQRDFFLGPPPESSEAPSWQHRFSIFIVVLLPWWLANALLGWAGAQSGPLESLFWVPAGLLPDALKPAITIGAAIWICLSPLAANTRLQLRRFYWGGLIGGAFLLYLQVVIPAVGQAHWLAGEISGSLALHALFSTSFFWLWLAAEVYRKAFPKGQPVVFGITALLTAGVLLYSADPLAHALTGSAALMLALYYPLVWEFLREQAEGIANSWKEWRFGPVRVINHGFYVGAAAFLGMLIGGSLAGEAYILGTVVFGIIGVVSAGLWGQFVEGSDKLKRPFGYYGSLLGILIAIFVLRWMGLDVWVMLAVFSVFMPWVQGIGRLRCLVNGCCHGAPADETLGIHYYHPRSRVCYLSGMKGKALHPTQLYSLLWLGLAGGIQLRLWHGGAEPSLLFGLYLILNGLGRFVEEAYRGEPQTPVFAGLRLYQWAAIASVLAGILITTIKTTWPVLSPGLTWTSVAWAFFMWGFVQFLMGIDFPQSQKRFSRLA